MNVCYADGRVPFVSESRTTHITDGRGGGLLGLGLPVTLCGLRVSRVMRIFGIEDVRCQECKRHYEIAMGTKPKRATA